MPLEKQHGGMLKREKASKPTFLLTARGREMGGYKQLEYRSEHWLFISSINLDDVVLNCAALVIDVLKLHSITVTFINLRLEKNSVEL